MSDATPSRSLEDRAANALNIVMVATLGGLAALFGLWTLMKQFGAVFAIYHRLSPQDQHTIDDAVSGLGLAVFWAWILLGALNKLRRRKAS